MGNIASILNMFKRIGNRDVVLTKEPKVIESADKLLCHQYICTYDRRHFRKTKIKGFCT